MLRIAWIREDSPYRQQPKLRKPTKAERLEMLSGHLIEKWRRRDRIKAELKYKKRLLQTSALESNQQKLITK